MKHIITFILLLQAGPYLASGQGKQVTGISSEIILFALNALVILLAIYIASSFVLSLIRLFLTDRLRRTLIEKSVSEQMIAQMLPSKDSQRETALKWCCLLIAGGLGLSICYFIQPLGLHSAIIMSFSLAAGLFTYYLISKPKPVKT